MLTRKEKEKKPAMNAEKGQMVEAARTAIGAAHSPALLQPAASDDDLVEAFKRYVALKEKLLENDDYVWIVFYKIGDKEERKFFPHREEAEAFAKQLEERKIKARLEKKVKKSGCLKLGKAFSISTSIIEAASDNATYFYFKVRASAPNGQSMERTGRCDRAEKGRRESPLDHMEATAMTRASNRAIMALLGGEVTAEELEEIPQADVARVSSSEPPKAATKKADAVYECPMCGERTVLLDTGNTSEVKCKVCNPPKKLSNKPPTHEEKLKEIDAKFVGAKPAREYRTGLMRRMFAMAKSMGMDEEMLDAKLKEKWLTMKSKKEMTVEMIELVIRSMEKKVARDERS